MARTKQSNNGASTAERSGVVFDEVFKTVKGSIRIAIDVTRIQNDAQRYHEHLLMTRRIPFNRDEISPLDPMVQVALVQMPELKERGHELMNYVRGHYESLSQAAYRDAMILAVSAGRENVFNFDPEPYDPTDESYDPLPGIPLLPVPKKDLTNPVERRLKQIMDLISSDVEVMLNFQRRFEDAIVLVQAMGGQKGKETDAEGFRPELLG